MLMSSQFIWLDLEHSSVRHEKSLFEFLEPFSSGGAFWFKQSRGLTVMAMTEIFFVKK